MVTRSHNYQIPMLSPAPIYSVYFHFHSSHCTVLTDPGKTWYTSLQWSFVRFSFPFFLSFRTRDGCLLPSFLHEKTHGPLANPSRWWASPGVQGFTDMSLWRTMKVPINTCPFESTMYIWTCTNIRKLFPQHQVMYRTSGTNSRSRDKDENYWGVNVLYVPLIFPRVLELLILNILSSFWLSVRYRHQTSRTLPPTYLVRILILYDYPPPWNRIAHGVVRWYRQNCKLPCTAWGRLVPFKCYSTTLPAQHHL